MSVLARIRAQGFEVRLTDRQTIAVKPSNRLPADMRNWISGNRQRVINELQAEAVPDVNTDQHQCSQCQHDQRSSFNPSGGLTSCAVRFDVPMMVYGTRKVTCNKYEPPISDAAAPQS